MYGLDRECKISIKNARSRNCKISKECHLINEQSPRMQNVDGGCKIWKEDAKSEKDANLEKDVNVLKGCNMS